MDDTKPVRRMRGRPRGSVGLRTQRLVDILESYGYSPAAELIWIAGVAKKEWERCEEIFDAIQEARIEKGLTPLTQSEATEYLDIMRNCAKDMMPFMYPKLKSVELVGGNGEDLFKSFVDMVKQVSDAKK